LDNIECTVDIDGETISEEYCVVFRDEYGKLNKRKPVSEERNVGQFVYVPDNFTTSGSISNTFNFRYNLPRYWEMPSKDTVGVNLYKSTYDLNTAIQNKEFDTKKLAYHSQYFFTTDKSINWNNIYDAKSVFITSVQDIDFSNKYTIGKYRIYYDGNKEISIDKKNTWTVDEKVSTPLNWTINNMENFYIDLNLCGKKNKYNMIEDNGCPVVIKNKTIHLDNFVSDILTIFLNGKVFDDTFAVNDLSSSYHKTNSSSNIINYYGFGKNIILPKFNGVPLDSNFVFIPVDDNEFIYYDFMVDNDKTTMDNYDKYFAEGKNNLFRTNYNKYTFK
jgi:hypothetical protein